MCQTFDPDRFAESSENAASAHSHSFIPFGFGSRQCPGERLAWWEMRLFFAVLFKDYDIALAVDPQTVVPVDNNALFARDDLPLHVVPRRSTLLCWLVAVVLRCDDRGLFVCPKALC